MTLRSRAGSPMLPAPVVATVVQVNQNGLRGAAISVAASPPSLALCPR